MAARVKKEFMFQQMRDFKLPFFVVTDGRDTIGENQEETGLEKAVELLENVIDNVEDSFVIVKLSDKTKKEIGRGGSIKNGLEYKIVLRESGSGLAGAGNTNSLVAQLMQQNKILEAALNQQKIDVLTDKFQRQIDDIKNSGSNPMMEKGLELLSGIFLKPTVGVAGADDGEVNQGTVNKEQKLKAALVRLSKVDKNLHNTLTLLADFAEANPSKYLSMIPMLKAF